MSEDSPAYRPIAEELSADLRKTIRKDVEATARETLAAVEIHFPVTDLVHFVAGKIEEEKRTRIQAHLDDGCEHCEAWIDGLEELKEIVLKHGGLPMSGGEVWVPGKGVIPGAKMLGTSGPTEERFDFEAGVELPVGDVGDSTELHED